MKNENDEGDVSQSLDPRSPLVSPSKTPEDTAAIAIAPTHEGPVVCPDCGGDGKETCHNPDHGFIDMMSGVRSDKHDIGRLGCPVCGHDEKHKVPGGRECETCAGLGFVASPVV